jgi:3-oxoacyl-[acyl-carrier protein] reductase
METAVKSFGRIDILVNNAGITKDSLMLTMKDENFDAVIDTNLRGTYLCMRHAARQMLRQKYGRIISISSVVGLRGNAGQCNYAASKAGIIGLTKSLARELAPRNITVNAVAPGYIETEMTGALSEDVKAQLKSQIPAGCLGTPEQVAQAVAFFVDAAYITGQVLRVDGGMAM